MEGPLFDAIGALAAAVAHMPPIIGAAIPFDKARLKQGCW